jgi:hypothetical protein
MTRAALEWCCRSAGDAPARAWPVRGRSSSLLTSVEQRHSGAAAVLA